MLTEIRVAFRRLAARPGFSVVAILTLALGIGANTAVFSLVNRLFLRPLPVARPSELVTLNEQLSKQMMPAFSYPDYKDIRDRANVFSGLAAYRFVSVALSGDRGNSRLWGYLVTGNYFETLGVQPLLGRFLTPADDVNLGGHPVAVLSYDCWRKNFGADPSLPGTTVRINGLKFTVLGVAPPSFSGTELFFSPQIYVPMTMAQQIEPGSTWIKSRDSQNLFLIGRVKPGIPRPEIDAKLNAIAAELGREYPKIDEGMKIGLTPPGLAGAFLRGPVLGFTGALLAVTALVLLIACTNLTGLLLARASDRRKEIGICLALGAGRGRLIRQMLTESLILAFFGGAGGVVLAAWITDGVAAWRPPIAIPLDFRSGIDWNVLVFTAAVVTVSSVLFGLAPALQATRGDLLPALKNAGGQFHKWAVRDAVVALQVALSVVLLAGSVLVLRSLQNAMSVNLGFDPQGVAIVRFDLGLQGYDKARVRDFQRRVLEKVRQLPAIESAAACDRLPLSMEFSKTGILVDGKPEPKPSDLPIAFSYDASPGFFRTMRTRLLAGRDFEPGDTPESPLVAIVNQAFVDQILHGEAPLGKKIHFRDGGKSRTIVGVVETGKQYTLGEKPEPAFWESIGQDYSADTTLIARSSLPAEQTSQLLRDVVLRMDPEIALSLNTTFVDYMSLPLFPARVAAGALGAFGLLALLLAALGIYGLMAYAIARRTREFGIRIALGASGRDLMGNALVRAGVLLGAGVVGGLMVETATGALFSAILYNVSPRDPLTLAVAAMLILGVGFVASLIPARRALRIDPAQALREE